MSLNENAHCLVERLLPEADRLGVAVRTIDGARVLDFGEMPATREAGLRLAEICLAGLAKVKITPSGAPHASRHPSVVVATDDPVTACLASQYAGWEVRRDGYFAMGSGPMRAAAAHEPLFGTIGRTERPSVAVGVLEAERLPPVEVVASIAEKCGVSPEQLTLLVAPVTTTAGLVQVVARSVETALHKLHELGFDLDHLHSATGSAPLPPIADRALDAIGRSNDAILYGGDVTLIMRGSAAGFDDLGPRVISAASPDHGRLFREIFAAADHDFYRLDPMLFGPAVLTLVSADGGASLRFGRFEHELVDRSFATEG